MSRNDLVKNCRVHPTHWLISSTASCLSFVASWSASNSSSFSGVNLRELTSDLNSEFFFRLKLSCRNFAT